MLNIRPALDWISNLASTAVGIGIVLVSGGGLAIAWLEKYWDTGELIAMGAVGFVIVVGGRATAVRLLPATFRKLRDVDWQQVLRFFQRQGAAVEVDTSDWLGAIGDIASLRQPVFPLGRRILDDGRLGSMVEYDFRETPHFLVAGLTGSGKTRSTLRPLIAMTAASGLFQVVIFDKSGRNFRSFLGYPNIHLVRYDEETLLPACEAVYGEVLRRDAWLMGLNAGASNYDTPPEEFGDVRADVRPPRLLVVFDEFTNLMAVLLNTNSKVAGRVTSALIRVAQEGRAMGVHMALVGQRPDATQINTTLRGQLAGITYAMRDATDARIAQAPGAENLERGQAIFSHTTGYDTMQMFYPSPADLSAMLGQYDPPDYGSLEWLPADVTAVTQDDVTTRRNTAVSGLNGGATSGDTNSGDTAVTPLRGGQPRPFTPTLARMAAERLFERHPDFRELGEAFTKERTVLTFLCLAAGMSKSATSVAVFNGRNGRYHEFIGLCDRHLRRAMAIYARMQLSGDTRQLAAG